MEFTDFANGVDPLDVPSEDVQDVEPMMGIRGPLGLRLAMSSLVAQ